MWWDAEGREPWFDIDDKDVPHMPANYEYEGKVCYNLRCHVMDIKENLPVCKFVGIFFTLHFFFDRMWRI